MESNVVSFIVENIFLFLPLGIIGIIVTLFLYLTGKKEEAREEDDLDADYVVLLKTNINVYVLIYLFIFFMMILIGILSNFVIPVVVGGVLASIPIVMMILVKIKTNRSKVL